MGLVEQKMLDFWSLLPDIWMLGCVCTCYMVAWKYIYKQKLCTYNPFSSECGEISLSLTL
jgi:hypothetical protein